LLDKVQVGLCDGIRVKTDVGVSFPFSVVAESSATVSKDGSIDDAMCNMNILFPKLLRQALRKGSDAEFASRKRARQSVPSERGRGAREDQRSLLPRTTFPALVRGLQTVLREFEEDFFGEGKGSDDVGVQLLADFLVGNFQEGLPDTVPGVE